MAAAGEHVFVAFHGVAGHEAGSGCLIHVYSAKDGSHVATLRPGPEVGGISMIDFQVGALNVRKRDDGTYVAFVEEDQQAKIIYYQWKPRETPQAPPAAAPESLRAFTGDGVAVLQWKRTAGAETLLNPLRDPLLERYTLKRSTKPEGPFSVIATDACKDDPLQAGRVIFADSGVEEGQTCYYTVSAVNDKGEGPASKALSVKPGRVENLAADGTFENDAPGAAPAGWQLTAGRWTVTDETSFSGKRCLKGTYNRSSEQPVGPTISTRDGIAPGRYRVEMVMASAKKVDGGEAGCRSPRTHLVKPAGGQDILDGTNRIVEPLGERNGKTWWRFSHDVVVQDDTVRLAVDLVYPVGSDRPDPAAVWVDYVKAYRYEEVQ